MITRKCESNQPKVDMILKETTYSSLPLESIDIINQIILLSIDLINAK